MRLLTLGTVLLVLAGCEDSSKFAPPCPQAAILADASDLVRYRAASASSPTGRDITDMILDGRITGIAGKCSAGEHSTTKVVTNITMDISRGPAATGRLAQITYFIAVAKGQDILDKQAYPVQVEFPANIDIVHVRSQDVVLNLPTDAKVSGAAYSVLAGFQLTPEELAANRARHP